MTTNSEREPYAGPESGPEAPFPIKLRGPVIKGFGRGSKQLGIPTANIPTSGLDAYPDLPNGVYFGWTSLQPPTSPSSTSTSTSTPSHTYPSVLSIGYNPYYANSTRSVEIHVLHKFDTDFYGSSLNLLILGYIRPERNYDGLQALIDDINVDCEVARRSLERSKWVVEGDGTGEWKRWLGDFEWASEMSKEDVEKMESKVLGGGPNAQQAKV